MKKTLKKKGIGYSTIIIGSSLISWFLGEFTNIDWCLKDLENFVTNNYLYIIVAIVAAEAGPKILKKIESKVK